MKVFLSSDSSDWFGCGHVNKTHGVQVLGKEAASLSNGCHHKEQLPFSRQMWTRMLGLELCSHCCMMSHSGHQAQHRGGLTHKAGSLRNLQNLHQTIAKAKAPVVSASRCAHFSSAKLGLFPVVCNPNFLADTLSGIYYTSLTISLWGKYWFYSWRYQLSEREYQWGSWKVDVSRLKSILSTSLPLFPKVWSWKPCRVPPQLFLGI